MPVPAVLPNYMKANAVNMMLTLIVKFCDLFIAFLHLVDILAVICCRQMLGDLLPSNLIPGMDPEDWKRVHFPSWTSYFHNGKYTY